MTSTSTTPSSSAAATTGSPTRRTSPRRGCAPWCWRRTRGRRRRDHRGADARLLVHDVLLRAEPAAARDHPRARPGRARVPAADDAVVVPPDRRRRLPALRRRPPAQNLQEIRRHSPRDADAYERYHHDLDRVCQAVRPLFDNPPPNVFGKDPEDAVDVKWLLDHLGGVEQKVMHDVVRLLTGSAVGLARRLLRARGDQGLPRLVVDHRLQGRADVAGLRPGAAVPQAGRARRPPRLVGVPQGRQRRLHPGPGPGRAGVRRGDPARRRRSRR